MNPVLLFLLLLAVFPAGGLEAQTADAGGNPFEISKADFFTEGSAPVRKSNDYDVTIVYFMDYQCPACRQYTPDVARVLKEDRRLRVIYRDTPLLGPRSDAAARAAIASSFQGRHEAFHHALMTTRGPLDEQALRAAAEAARVDWARLQRDLASRSNEIDEVIVRNHELAAATGIQGTPAFIVGESQSNGALDYKALKAEISDARKAMGKAALPGVPGEPPDDSRPTAKTEAEPAVIEAAEGSRPIFMPARPIAEKAVPGPVGQRAAGWMWLAALVGALAGSMAAWKLLGALFSARSRKGQ